MNICAWCATDADREEAARLKAAGTPISHGICDACARRLEGEHMTVIGVDPIARKPVTSSNLVAVGYDPATSTLAVEFKGGAVYHYGNVPAQAFDDLMASPSPGSLLAFMKKQTTDTGDPKYPVHKMAVVPIVDPS